MFHPLDGETLAAITRQLLAQTGERLAAQGISLQVEEDPAADLMLEGCLRRGDTLQVTEKEGRLQVRPGPQGPPPAAE